MFINLRFVIKEMGSIFWGLMAWQLLLFVIIAMILVLIFQKERESKVTLKSLIHQERKLIVRLRMWYAKIRGHKGKRWDYEPSEHYMGWHKHDKH